MQVDRDECHAELYINTARNYKISQCSAVTNSTVSTPVYPSKIRSGVVFRESKCRFRVRKEILFTDRSHNNASYHELNYIQILTVQLIRGVRVYVASLSVSYQVAPFLRLHHLTST
jgi:hypothetical protein